MNKIWLIIQREYLTRVKKKSFLILTVLTPVIFAAIMIIPSWLAIRSMEKSGKILVIDRSGLFHDLPAKTGHLELENKDIPLEEAKKLLFEPDWSGVLYIPQNPEKNQPVLYFNEQPSVVTVEKLENLLENALQAQKLREKFGIGPEEIKKLKANISIKTVKRDESGKEEIKQNEVSMMLGLFLALAIYMFIFMYGVQVMRGVIEEKTNRIVEIIISSVKPFQLMMGKILGIALVGLTQLTLWIVLTLLLAGIGQSLILSGQKDKIKSVNQKELIQNMLAHQGDSPDLQEISKQLPAQPQMGKMLKIVETVRNLPWGKIVFGFVFYFLFGYLIYAALFAAIGAAVDTQEDTQQFIFPVTAPLILSMVLAQFLMMNPDGPLAFWLSLFPLTSPVVMMIRIPFDVPTWQIVLSAVLLILGFLAATWLAAKIYRTGILMYGKKASYKELFKWLRY